MSKSDDINTLFSLLDKKPEGTYQDIVVNEELSESKNRWPIFDLSDDSSKKQQLKADEQIELVTLGVEQDTYESSKCSEGVVLEETTPEPKQSVLMQNQAKIRKAERNEQTRFPPKKEEGLGFLGGMFATKKEKAEETVVKKEAPSHASSLEAIFSRLSKKDKIEKTSVFDKLIKK